jgi:hypothetical protein
MLDEIRDGLQGPGDPLAGRSVRDLLLDPDTDLGVLRRLKTLYKEQNAMAANRPEQDVATTLYYAAVAAGLAYHHRRLSSYSSSELAKALADLSRKSWVAQDLKALFNKAGQVCKKSE